MTRASWLATTGLCILLATSAAQAHPILLDAASSPSGTEAGDAYRGVAFTEVAERTTMVCWHKAEGEGATSSAAGSSGNCLRQKRPGRATKPDRATDLIRFDATQATNSHLAGAFDTAGGLLSLTSALLTIDHSQIQQPLRLISAAGTLGGISIGGNSGHSIVNSVRHNATPTATTTTPTATGDVPEPATLVLMMMGLIGVAVATRGRRQASRSLVQQG